MSTTHICCARQRVKRGLWSPEEDEKLVNYVTTHGHGCWSTVPRLAGLQRCGKSCRLRWINYLRPDLKRGNFTSKEASLIIELHRVVGNRWAQIAKRLPGRTDNEVKNFWNANIKRKLLAHHSLSSVSDPTALTAFPENLNQNLNQNMFLMTSNNHLNHIPSTSQLIHQPNYTLQPPPSHLNPPLQGMDYGSALEPTPFSADLPPLPVSYNNINFYNNNPGSIMDQNYLQQNDTYQPFDRLDNLTFNLDNPDIDDRDLDLLDALMPEIADLTEGIGCDFPAGGGHEALGPAPAAGVLGFGYGADSGSAPLHPNHISNIRSLMTTFAPADSLPPEAWDVSFLESPRFAPSDYWGPQPMI